MSLDWIYACAVVLMVVVLVFVIRRAVKRADREERERAARKFGKPTPGPLETLLKDTRPQWDGSKSGES